jgi:hypothetical protein
MQFYLSLLSFVIILNSVTSQTFKIGCLLPELHFDYYRSIEDLNESTQSFSQCKKSNSRKEIAIWNAISFASKEMARLFHDFYSCEISLSQAETQVLFILMFYIFIFIFFNTFIFKCDVSYGTQSFFELAKNNHQTLMIFGGSCDSSTKSIAESVQYFNLTMV